MEKTSVDREETKGVGAVEYAGGLVVHTFAYEKAANQGRDRAIVGRIEVNGGCM